MASGLNFEFSKRTHIFHLKVWILLAIFLGVFLVAIILLLPFCLSRKTKKACKKALPVTRIPAVSKEIREIQVYQHSTKGQEYDMDLFSLALEEEKSSNKDSVKLLSSDKGRNAENERQYGVEKDESSGGGSSNHSHHVSSPLSGLPEFSHLGWGHWFTLRDLEIATDKFSKQHIVGEGGYGVVYHGQLVNGTPVAVKKIFNNIGQAEKEFRVEVEAIGRGRHKNLVRLIGYCVEGTQRLLVYEYVNNGNLEQWIHGGMSHHGVLTWEARMKVLIGTAKALAYLHEALEPKVVHRDIKSGNILIDDEFNAKLSDFGLAKLLGAGKSHITTRVMGTFGYVAPEYANSGLLNEKSDVYSFGVVLLEAISGRDPVDYDRPAPEVNLVEWLKTMVGSKRFEVVVDPKIETKPSTAELKRALLTALRCVDPDADKRPVMSQVVRMLESEEYPISREGRRKRRNETEVEPGADRRKQEMSMKESLILKAKKKERPMISLRRQQEK